MVCLYCLEPCDGSLTDCGEAVCVDCHDPRPVSAPAKFTCTDCRIEPVAKPLSKCAGCR